MADFIMITSRLATGASIDTPADVEQLVAAGITAVVDERAEFDDSGLLSGSGMAYLWNPTEDDGMPKPDAWWQANITFSVQQYSSLGSAIYLHCRMGVNRGPSAAYGVLRACLGLSPEQAQAMIHAVRPQAQVAYAADFEHWWAENKPVKPELLTRRYLDSL